MPLHIKDETATLAVRRLAAARGVSLTEAVRAACVEALQAGEKAQPVERRLAELHATIRAARRPGREGQVTDDKAFFDEQWERGL